MIKTAHINILESASVSLLSGTEDPAYPMYRLYDRNIGRSFRTIGGGNVEILVDQGSGSMVQFADTLIIPFGHNLDGMAVEVKYSDDSLNYTEAVPLWTAGNSLVAKTWAPVAKRYWKINITSQAITPSIPEIFLTSSYEWERLPQRPQGPMEDQHNIIAQSTADGRMRFLKAGPARRRRIYNITRCPFTMRQQVLLLWNTWGEGKPFWLYEETYDQQGQWIYGGLDREIKLTEIAFESYSLEFDFVEALP